MSNSTSETNENDNLNGEAQLQSNHIYKVGMIGDELSNIDSIGNLDENVETRLKSQYSVSGRMEDGDTDQDELDDVDTFSPKSTKL